MARTIDRELVMDTLRVLKRSGEYLYPLDVLYTAVNGSRIDPVQLSTFKDHVAHAEEKGWMEYRVDRIDGTKRWYITTAGETALAKG